LTNPQFFRELGLAKTFTLPRISQAYEFFRGTALHPTA